MADLTEPVDAKSRARRDAASALSGLSPARRRAAGLALARQLRALPAVMHAGTVMAFLSLPTEIDTWPVIRWAWDLGKRVAIPRLGRRPEGGASPARERRMVPVLLEAADVEAASAHPAVRPGALGILTAPEAPSVPAENIDVVFVPCQAVDRRGNRLGKGGGYYDRFLARPEVRAVRIALVFREQIVDTVPVGRHDEPMDWIVTEGEVLRLKRPAGNPAAAGNPPTQE